MFGNLYQGPKPPTGLALRDAGFDLLILCAADYQENADKFPGVSVIHAPGDDDREHPPAPHWVSVWTDAAKSAAEALQADKKVLVTCYAGLNRSGFVTALTLRFVTGWSGARCVELVQKRRFNALFNEYFIDYLSALPAIDPLADSPVQEEKSD